jgi:hypothetical protein
MSDDKLRLRMNELLHKTTRLFAARRGGDYRGRLRHAQRRVWALGVVARDPPIELCLCGGQVVEDPSRQELLAQRPVEPLDLAGGGGAPGRREQVVDAVLAEAAVVRRPACCGRRPGSSPNASRIQAVL